MSPRFNKTRTSQCLNSHRRQSLWKLMSCCSDNVFVASGRSTVRTPKCQKCYELGTWQWSCAVCVTTGGCSLYIHRQSILMSRVSTASSITHSLSSSVFPSSKLSFCCHQQFLLISPAFRNFALTWEFGCFSFSVPFHQTFIWFSQSNNRLLRCGLTSGDFYWPSWQQPLLELIRVQLHHLFCSFVLQKKKQIKFNAREYILTQCSKSLLLSGFAVLHSYSFS